MSGQQVILGTNPIKVNCPNCRKDVTTETESETPDSAVLIGFILFFV